MLLQALHCCLHDVAVMLESDFSWAAPASPPSPPPPPKRSSSAPAFMPQAAAGHCKIQDGLAAPSTGPKTPPAPSHGEPGHRPPSPQTGPHAVQVEPGAAPGACHPGAGAGGCQPGCPGTHGRPQRHLPQPAGPPRHGRRDGAARLPAVPLPQVPAVRASWTAIGGRGLALCPGQCACWTAQGAVLLLFARGCSVGVRSGKAGAHLRKHLTPVFAAEYAQASLHGVAMVVVELALGDRHLEAPQGALLALEAVVAVRRNAGIAWCREVNFASCPITDGALWHLAHHSAEQPELQAVDHGPGSSGDGSPQKSLAGAAPALVDTSRDHEGDLHASAEHHMTGACLALSRTTDPSDNPQGLSACKDPWGAQSTRAADLRSSHSLRCCCCC